MKLTTYTRHQKSWQPIRKIGLFWRYVPGVSTPGHWMSITLQAIRQSKSRLDKAAAGVYALTGICENDAVISVFHYKYVYNMVRPVTYIRNVIGDATWASFIPTPNHPEYPAAHGCCFFGCCWGIDGGLREYRAVNGSYLGLSGISSQYIQYFSRIWAGCGQFQILWRDPFLSAFH